MVLAHGLIAHQQILHGGVVAGDEHHQLHPGLVGVGLLLLGSEAVGIVEEADVEVGQILHGHVRETDVGALAEQHLLLLVHGLAVGALAHIGDAGVGQAGDGRLLVGIVRDGVAHQLAILDALGLELIAALGLLPEGDDIRSHIQHHPDGDGAVSVDGDDAAVGTLGAVGGQLGQEGVGEVVALVGVVGQGQGAVHGVGLLEEGRGHLGEIQGAVLEAELSVVQIAALHQLGQGALGGGHAGGSGVVGCLLVDEDLSGTQAVAAAHGDTGGDGVAGVPVDEDQLAGTDDGGQQLENCRAGGAAHLPGDPGDDVVVIDGQAVFIHLVGDHIVVSAGGSHVLVGDVELADEDGDMLQAGDGHEDVLGDDVVGIAPDPHGGGGGHGLVALSTGGLAVADLAVGVQAEGIERSVVVGVLAIGAGHRPGLHKAHGGEAAASGHHGRQIGRAVLVAQDGGSGHAAAHGAVAQLTAAVAAPGIDVLVGGEDHAVDGTGGQSHHILAVGPLALGEGELHGLVGDDAACGATAQLAVLVVAPADDAAVVEQSQGVVEAVVDLEDLPAAQVIHPAGQSTGAVDLALAIGTLGHAVLLEEQLVLGGIDTAGVAAQLGLGTHAGHGGAGMELGAAAQTDLTVLVRAPAPEGTVVAHGVDGVAAAALGQVDDLAQAGDTHGRVVDQLVVGAQAQLAHAVGAEGVDTAIVGEDSGVLQSGDYLAGGGLDEGRIALQ